MGYKRWLESRNENAGRMPTGRKTVDLTEPLFRPVSRARMVKTPRPKPTAKAASAKSKQSVGKKPSSAIDLINLHQSDSQTTVQIVKRNRVSPDCRDAILTDNEELLNMGLLVMIVESTDKLENALTHLLGMAKKRMKLPMG